MAAPEFHQTFIRLRSAGHWLVSPELRPRLVADAHENDLSLTEVINQILGRRFSVELEPSTRKTIKPDLEGEELNIRVPLSLYRRINVHAAQQGKPAADVIREALSAHYGLAVPPKPPRAPRAPRSRRPAVA